MRTTSTAAWARLSVWTFLIGLAVFGPALPRGSLAAPAPVTSVRLYVFDCGTIGPMDPTLFNLTEQELHRKVNFVTPCFLVVHPKGTLMWDVGQVQDSHIPTDGVEVTEQGILHTKHRLLPQLAAVGYKPGNISYIALSHYHADHTANANLFAGSVWIVQQAEYDAMFSDDKAQIRDPESYKDLQNSKRITLQNEDHDVFGDGTVIIKTAPGHTQGHQMLFLKLKHYGPLLLAGDLYHLPEERSLDRVPTFDFNAGMTRATRGKVEEFVKQSHAKLWIQHDAATFAAARKAPKYYD